jgi:secretion/DNA translocation related TadE-like protein
MRRRAVTRRRPQHGVTTLSATVMAAAVIGAALVLLQVGLAVAVKHRVQAAADLSALAGSSAVLRGRDACSAARAVAGRHDVHLSRCTVDLAVVTVQAVGRPGRTWGVGWRARAVARAAPSYYEVPSSAARSGR